MDKHSVLVVDDEEHILELLQYNLEMSGFEVYVAGTVTKAMEILKEREIHTILLDVMLPDMDGLTALRKIREMEATRDIPVLMVTAKSEEIDKIIGLELGADDYICKPFSVREVTARVNAVVRRQKRSQAKVEESSHILRLKELELDIESHSVKGKGKEIEMTLKEFELLKLLIQNKGKVLTRQVLLDQVWGYDYYGETRTVDVHIRYLRAKLAQIEMDDCIETVRGVGYKVSKE
ncbi:MAG: winged helix-turn-helix domain-containing protein [Cellulosilyticaceae bacterium]